jgi:hypothetical protein
MCGAWSWLTTVRRTGGAVDKTKKNNQELIDELVAELVRKQK